MKSQSGLLEIAKEPTPEKEVAKVAAMQKRAEDRKIVQKAGDEIVQRDASDDAAEMILDFVPEQRVPALLSYLDACGVHRLSKAIRREVKTGNRRGAAMRRAH